MLERLFLRLEIIGYSRAIGAMSAHPGVTAAMVKSLYEGRADAQSRLATLKKEAYQERFGKTLTNA